MVTKFIASIKGRTTQEAEARTFISKELSIAKKRFEIAPHKLGWGKVVTK